MKRLKSRKVSAAAIGAAGAVISALLVFPATQVSAAAPTGDCAKPFPLSDVAADQAVTGMTVGKGTTPDPFTGKVIGVLEDGIFPGLDMVLVELKSPEIDRVGGIWAGMSGSPVYAADGRLIGAVSYSLAYGASPVAGVTPFEAMDDYLAAGAGSRQVKVNAKTARLIARETSVTAAQAQAGLERMRIPMGVSGVDARGMKLADTSKWLHKVDYRMGAAPSAGGAGAPGPETITAGGNLAATISYGDITFGGVGTATSVCDNKVVGFGHPFTFDGKTSLTIHPATAIGVQKDLLYGGFKLANFGAPAGTIDRDNLAGITGTLGAPPDTARVSSTVSYGSRTGSGESRVSRRGWAGDVTLYQIYLNHLKAIDGYQPGSAAQTYTIKGLDENGKPFSFTQAQRYVDKDDITVSAAFDVGYKVFRLNRLGAKVSDVSSAVKVSDDAESYRLGKVEQFRNGAWVTVNEESSLVVKVKGTLKLRATLMNKGVVAKTVTLSGTLPASWKAGQGSYVTVGGGGNSEGDDEGFGDSSPESVAELLKSFAEEGASDQVQANVRASNDRSFRFSSSSSDKVITGLKFFELTIKR